MEQSEILENVNTIPCLTWNWLKMNRDSVRLLPNVQVKNARTESVPDGCECFVAGAKPDSGSEQFPCGAGAAFSSFVEKVSGGAEQVIRVSGKMSEPLVLEYAYAPGESAVSVQHIFVDPGAQALVVFLYRNETEESGGTAADGGSAESASYIRTRISARAGSKVRVVKVQLLSERTGQVDDTAFVADENADIQFTQIELGGNHLNSGVHVVLDGDRSKFKSELAFICRNGQHLDVNHYVVHKGCGTDTKMSAKGVVDGNALKTYRGTIDFQNGCHGATGDEQEETLLMSRTAVSKSIPIILCDEEDVAGTHGATLGRLGSDELFYMQSRGISEDEAKLMMKKAKIMGAAASVPDTRITGMIEEWLEKNS